MYLKRCYFHDLFTSKNVVAAMLPIMIRLNAILKSGFVNIQAFHISLEKQVKIRDNKLTSIQGHLQCCNYSPSFEDFSILASVNNKVKSTIRRFLKKLNFKIDFSTKRASSSISRLLYIYMSLLMVSLNCAKREFESRLMSIERESIWTVYNINKCYVYSFSPR